MGAVKTDTNKNERKIETKYALNTAEGVQLLFADIPYLEERKYLKGDYDASNVLMDIEEAVENSFRAKVYADRLTDRQQQSLDLIFVQGYTYEEAGEIMQITPSTVFEHCEKGATKIAKVFESWDYNEVTILKLSKEMPNESR